MSLYSTTRYCTSWLCILYVDGDLFGFKQHMYIKTNITLSLQRKQSVIQLLYGGKQRVISSAFHYPWNMPCCHNATKGLYNYCDLPIHYHFSQSGRSLHLKATLSLVNGLRQRVVTQVTPAHCCLGTISLNCFKPCSCYVLFLLYRHISFKMYNT